MSFWSASNVATAAGGDARPTGFEIIGVSIDTRTIKPGMCFVAIKGETHDGHDYVPQAIAAGATMVIAYKTVNAGSTPVVMVDDTRKALARLASAYRTHLGTSGTKVIAVCGSNGKTTTCRFMEAALSAKLKGTASKKSFNNDIGVPLTILAAKEGDRYLICEVGSNAPGEIDTLGAIVRPDIAVITSIGREHLQGFGDLEGVMREEASITRHVVPNGTVVYTPYNTLAWLGLRMPEPRRDLKIVYVDPSSFTNVKGVELEGVAGGIGTRWNDSRGGNFVIALPGPHNALNATLAATVARLFGLDNVTIAEALRGATGPEMRLQRLMIGDHIVINDAYNANPESMLASLGTFVMMTPKVKRRVAVLGDMRELGNATHAAHEEVLRRALSTRGIDRVVTVGPSFAAALESVERASPPAAGGSGALAPSQAHAGAWASSAAGGDARSTEMVHSLFAGRVFSIAALTDDALAGVTAHVRPGDAVLLKASRGVRLERLIPMLQPTMKIGGEGAAR